MNTDKTEAMALAFEMLDEETFLHSMRLANMTDNDQEFIIAVLHDVVEDSDITIDYIGENYDRIVTLAVDTLTRGKGETYSEYIDYFKGHIGMEFKIAIKIKILDLKDHLAIERIGDIPISLVERYIKAYKILTEVSGE